MLNNSIPGILLQFKIEESAPYLNEGVNVLSVVIIDRGGERHQSNLSFTYSAKHTGKSNSMGWLEIINSTNKKSEFRELTLNNLFGYYNKNEKQIEFGMEEYKNFLSTLKPMPVDNKKQKIIKDNKITNLPVIKTETIIVFKRDAKGRETQTGKPIVISYSSSIEKQQQLVKLKLDASTNRKKNQFIKTIQVAYDKPLTILDKNRNEITRIIRSSTYINREEIHIHNKTKVQTVYIDYITEDERKKAIKKLVASGTKYTTGNIVKIEKIIYKEANGKAINSLINDQVFNDSKGLPNLSRKEREAKELVKVLGAKAINGIWIPEFNSVKGRFINSVNNIPAEKDISKRLSEGLSYFQNQQKIKL